MSEICIVVTIVVYLVAMLLVGFAYSKTNNDSTDFYLGGRKMGPLVTAMSAEASDMSSWLLMGMPGLAYLTGIASPGWTAIGLALGTWLNWLIVARRLRRYSANLDAITVPQFLSLRFHDQRNLLNALGAVIIIVFFVPYTASGFAACGKLFHSLFGVDYMAAMLVSALVIVGYTILGGFRAVTTTDLIQSVVMSLALIAVLGYGIVVAGGWGAVVENAQSLSGYLTMTASHDADRRGRILQPAGHCLHHGVGPRLLRYAPHPAPLHGHRGREEAGAQPPHCHRLGGHRHGGVHRHRHGGPRHDQGRCAGIPQRLVQ